MGGSTIDTGSSVSSRNFFKNFAPGLRLRIVSPPLGSSLSVNSRRPGTGGPKRTHAATKSCERGHIDSARSLPGTNSSSTAFRSRSQLPRKSSQALLLSSVYSGSSGAHDPSGTQAGHKSLNRGSGGSCVLGSMHQRSRIPLIASQKGPRLI